MKRITLIVFMILYIPVLLLRASNNVQDDFVDMKIDNSSLSCEDFDNNSLAVVLDKNGYLHVAYCLNDGASHIFYRYDNGSGILSPVIDNISVENCKPLALDIDNSSKYHLAFSLSGNDIAYKNQGDNDSQEVPSTSGIIDNLTTIGIADNSTNIFIVYGFDNSTSHYLFVYDNSSNNSYMIDNNSNDRFTGAAITVDGAYYYITYKVGTLQLFKTNNPMWDNRTIADNVTGDGISSIKFYNDYIDISYFDGNSLKLAKIGDNTTLYNMNIESGDFKYSAVNLFNSGENRIVIYSDNETLKYFNDDDNSSYIITDNFSLCPTYNPPAIKPFDLMATPDNKIIFGYYNSISDNFTYTYLPNTITLAITGNGKIQERSPDNRTLYNNDNLSYKYKTKISLTADPDSGYFFNGWGELCGSCGDNLSCNIIVNQDGYCMAQFSDTIEINGYVIDNNSFPVDNIKVHLCLINDNGELDCETNGKTYDTDSSGRFGFSNVAIGRYVIYTEPKDNYSIAWYNEVASENSEESPEFQNGATIIYVNPDKIKTNISGITIKLRNGKIVNGSILNGNNNDTIFVTPYYVDQESQIQVFDFPVEFNGDNFTIKGLQDDMWYSIGYHDNTNGVKYFNVALVKSGYDNITVDRNKIVGSFFIEGNIDNSQSLIDLKYLGLYRLKNFTENDLIEKYDLLSGQQYSFKNLTPGKYYIKLVGNSHECYLLKNGKFFCDWHGEYPIPLKIFEISNSNITEDILISDENYIFPDENELIRQDYNDVNIIVANNSDNVVSFDIYLEYDDSPLDKIPDHYHSNNSEISLKLDNLTYRYWALVEYDNGSKYTTNGWDNFTVDNSSIYLDNITTTPVHNTVIIFDNSSKNLSGNKLIIYKDDRIFKKIDFEKKFITDRYVIPYLPPGTYNFALDSHYLIPPSHISYPKFFTYCDNGTRDVTISENNFQFVCKSSEGYSLSGYVIDNSTNDNISDALVQIFFDNRKIFLPTDAKGYFSVYGLKPESSVIVKVQYDNKTGRIVIDNLTGDNISNVQIDESSYKVSGQLIYKNNSNNGLSGFIEFYNSDNQSMGSVFTNQDGSFTFYNTDDSDVRYGVRYYSSYYRSSDDISSGSTNIIIDLPGPFPWNWRGFFEIDTEGNVGKRNYNFGDVAVDSYKTYDIYIFNNSESTASVDNISLQNNQAFSIVSETCTDDNEVRPYSNCKISVKFSPDTLGEDYEDYLIAYIFNRKYTLKLSGTCAGGLVRNGESEGGNSGGGIISGGDSGSGIISGGRDETEDKINDISDAIGELNDKLDTLNENNVSDFYLYLDFHARMHLLKAQ